MIYQPLLDWKNSYTPKLVDIDGDNFELFTSINLCVPIESSSSSILVVSNAPAKKSDDKKVLDKAGTLLISVTLLSPKENGQTSMKIS
jgi:Tfp pilus assembly protein PilW